MTFGLNDDIFSMFDMSTPNMRRVVICLIDESPVSFHSKDSKFED